MVVTLLGMLIFVSFSQKPNVESPMLVKFSDKVTRVKSSQP